MADRYADWHRKRFDDATTSAQQAQGRKVLGLLMEELKLSGLPTGVKRWEATDGTLYIASFDGTTPTVEVINPETPNPLVQGCTPLVGKIGKAKPFNHLRMFFPNWPDQSVSTALRAPFMASIYTLVSGSEMLRYTPDGDRFESLPLKPDGAPAAIMSAMAPYLYTARNEKLHFACMAPDLSAAYEYEFGTGWLPTRALTPYPGNVEYRSSTWPAVSNAEWPRQWVQATDALFGLKYKNFLGHLHVYAATTYDFVKHSLRTLVPFAFNDTGSGTVIVAAMGELRSRIYSLLGESQLGQLYNATTQQYAIPATLALYGANGIDPTTVRQIGVRFVPAATSQLCTRVYMTGAVAAPRFVDPVYPDYPHGRFDFQLLPDYSQVAELNLETMQVRHIGHLPLSATDAQHLYNQAASLIGVPMADRLLIFYPELAPIVPTPADPTLPQYDITGINMVEVT